MKNCDEMVNSLLERRDRYATEQKRKRKVITRTVTSMCCVCLVALFRFGVPESGLFDTTPPVTNGNVTHFPNNYSPNGSEKTMISSFNVNETLSASYETPENSKFYFSIPLREAMNEYKNSVMYRVVVDVFNNKEQLASDSSQVQDECERLSNMGYVVAYETVFDGKFYHYYFTLHATYDELIDFIANENYGYFMFLYDERVE